MDFYDVRRYALILAIQAEIEGMKAANNQHPDEQPYTDEDFKVKAEELRRVVKLSDIEKILGEMKCKRCSRINACYVFETASESSKKWALDNFFCSQFEVKE